VERVLVSYGRDSYLDLVRPLFERLKNQFGPERVLISVRGDPLWDEAERQRLTEQINKCNLVLAVLGRERPPARNSYNDERYRPAFEEEIAAAFKKNKCVIPVLVGRTKHLRLIDLPQQLKLLAHCETIRLRDDRLASDLGMIASAVTNHFSAEDPALAVMPGSGRSFRDCLTSGRVFPLCPEMVVVPAGSFVMGSPASEIDREEGESQVRVDIARPFAVGRHPVTFDEWDAFTAEGGCDNFRPIDFGWGRRDRPVINVCWHDAKSYVSWLSAKTGKAFRLLAEAEWEYAARAGTSTPFWWGSSIDPEQANYDGRFTYANGVKGAFRARTVAVNSFSSNPWGLYDVHGNVWEWTEDHWHESHTGNPGDGSPRLDGDYDQRVLRGGAWDSDPSRLRGAFRLGSHGGIRYYGFRVARALQDRSPPSNQ
jgi:formylglycine-generating enzyme required for sulfatase activity